MARRSGCEFNERYFRTGNYLDYLNRQDRYDSIASEIEPFLVEPIIDFGCGVGFLVSSLLRRGWEISGHDVSEWAIEYGKKKFKLESHIGTNAPEKNQKTLISLDVFEHIELDVVFRILENLSPEKMVVRIPVCLEEGGDFYYPESRRDKTHITCLTKEKWECIFSRLGYQLEHIFQGTEIWDSDGVLSRSYVKM